MTVPAMTVAEVDAALKQFGNYRVLRCQQLAGPTFFHPSVVMALGLRESGLRNICGGAKKENGVWVSIKTDRGFLQINEKAAGVWLSTVPGCKDGQWVPDDHSVDALTPLHVPRLTDAVVYTLGKAFVNRRFALNEGVKEQDVLRFCVAAHNAGYSGAMQGYENGNVDEHTTRGDYSAWVLAHSSLIHNWVLEHPSWRYHSQNLGPAPSEPSF